MRWVLLFAAVLLTASFAGCAGSGGRDVEPASGGPLSPGLVPGIVQEHDHADTSLHGSSEGVGKSAYHSLVPGTQGGDAGDRGAWLNTEIALHAGRAFVGYAGAPWLLAVVDVEDPERPELLGTVDGGGAWAMDVDASEDGRWAYVSVYNGQLVGSAFDRGYVAENPPSTVGPSGPGVAVVDARDPRNPVVSDFLPIHGFGPHTAIHHTMPDGSEYVFANKAEGSPGNAIVVAEVLETPGGGQKLVPVSEFHMDVEKSLSFPHDVDVQEHPVTGQVLLYAAWYGRGLVVLDVSDPSSPEMVAQFRDYPHEDGTKIHDVHPYPRLVNGHHYTVSGPEIIGGENTGHLRIYDTTDPAAPALVGAWRLPGDYVVDEPFLFSTHNFDFLPDGRIALAHGHAGVWVIDWLGAGGAEDPDPARVRDPVATGYYVPHEAGAALPDWDPVSGSPWVWGTQVDDRGRVWASDSATGLYALTPSDR